MKNRIIKTIAITLAVILLMSTFSGNFVYAISESCAEDHFGHLLTTTDGNGNTIVRTPPSEMSCAYVAMSMLLTFYDSYWNNRFVDDNYEWQNGIYNPTTDKLQSTFAPLAEAEDWQEFISTNIPIWENTFDYYRGYAESKSDSYLEPYLISIGNSLNFHPNPDSHLGLNNLQIMSILEEYLFIDGRFQANELTIRWFSENQGNLDSAMDDQLSQGFPLIYLGTDENGEGHAMIAYGQDGNTILYHTGWIGNSYMTSENLDYVNNRIIIWLEINEENLPHTCSDNYVNALTNTLMCSCEIYDSHAAHTVQDYHSFEFHNSNTHSYRCDCGFTFNDQPHTLTYSYHTPTQHYKRCSGCNYLGPEDHVYKPQSSTSPLGHQLACVCGQTSSTQSHYVSYCRPMNNDLHYVYCECGYIIETDTHSMVIGWKPGTSTCRKCGYIRDDSGLGNVIMGDEEEIEND